MDLDWKSIAGTVAPFAPSIGKVLGAGFGPVGSVIGGIAGSAIAAAFGVEETPEAVGKAITEDPQAADKLRQLESERGQEILAQAQVKIEELKQETEQQRIAAGDTQQAREAQERLTGLGSALAWAPVAVSIIIIAGFSLLSYIAMRPQSIGADPQVTMYLLAAWQSLATLAAGFWLGSSAGSKRNADRFADLAQTIANRPNPSPGAVEAIKAAAGKKK